MTGGCRYLEGSKKGAERCTPGLQVQLNKRLPSPPRMQRSCGVLQRRSAAQACGGLSGSSAHLASPPGCRGTPPAPQTGPPWSRRPPALHRIKSSEAKCVRIGVTRNEAGRQTDGGIAAHQHCSAVVQAEQLGRRLARVRHWIITPCPSLPASGGPPAVQTPGAGAPPAPQGLS